MKKISKNFLSKFALVVVFLMFFTTQVVRATELSISTIDNNYVLIVDEIRGTTRIDIEGITIYVVPDYELEFTIEEIVNLTPTTMISSNTTVVSPGLDLDVQVPGDYEVGVTVEETTTVTTTNGSNTTVTESGNTSATVVTPETNEVTVVIEEETVITTPNQPTTPEQKPVDPKDPKDEESTTLVTQSSSTPTIGGFQKLVFLLGVWYIILYLT